MTSKEGKPFSASAGKPSDGKKPYKKFGGNKSAAYMMAMLEAIDQKRVLVSLKSARNARTTPVVILTVNRNLGMITRG
jgi:hypothetical protein